MSNLRGPDSKGYYTYNCEKCGEEAHNNYVKPTRDLMLAKQYCFTCQFWSERAELLKDWPNIKKHERITIIGGHWYSPGDGRPDSSRRHNFLGMGGRRFDIEYIDGPHKGKIITCFDLWSGGLMPDDMKVQFPDNARFVGHAEKIDCDNGMSCWNPSDGAKPEYTRPATLFAR